MFWPCVSALLSVMNHLELMVEEAEIPSIDLNELVSKNTNAETKKSLFLGGNDPCHFSERGHEIVARKRRGPETLTDMK